MLKKANIQWSGKSVGGSSAKPEKIRERMAALDALLEKGEEDENSGRD